MTFNILTNAPGATIDVQLLDPTKTPILVVATVHLLPSQAFAMAASLVDHAASLVNTTKVFK